LRLAPADGEWAEEEEQPTQDSRHEMKSAAIIWLAPFVKNVRHD